MKPPKQCQQPVKLTNEEVWVRAWIGTIAAFNTDRFAADKYADHALEQFKKRFRDKS